MTDEQAPFDPHNLLASGAELATAPELARLLGVSRASLTPLLRGPLYKRVRFVRMRPGAGGHRYSVADVRRAIEPHREALGERRHKADEREAQEQAAAAARKAAMASAPKPAQMSTSNPAPRAVAHARRPNAPPLPEVVVRRRHGALRGGDDAQ
jgi:hypothetical protein